MAAADRALYAAKAAGATASWSTSRAAAALLAPRHRAPALAGAVLGRRRLPIRHRVPGGHRALGHRPSSRSTSRSSTADTGRSPCTQMSPDCVQANLM